MLSDTPGRWRASKEFGPTAAHCQESRLVSDAELHHPSKCTHAPSWGNLCTCPPCESPQVCLGVSTSSGRGRKDSLSPLHGLSSNSDFSFSTCDDLLSRSPKPRCRRPPFLSSLPFTYIQHQGHSVPVHTVICMCPSFIPL